MYKYIYILVKLTLILAHRSIFIDTPPSPIPTIHHK